MYSKKKNFLIFIEFIINILFTNLYIHLKKNCLINNKKKDLS